MRIRFSASELKELMKSTWAERQANAIERKLAEGYYAGTEVRKMERLARKYRKQADAFQNTLFI